MTQVRTKISSIICNYWKEAFGGGWQWHGRSGIERNRILGRQHWLGLIGVPFPRVFAFGGKIKVITAGHGRGQGYGKPAVCRSCRSVEYPVDTHVMIKKRNPCHQIPSICTTGECDFRWLLEVHSAQYEDGPKYHGLRGILPVCKALASLSWQGESPNGIGPVDVV